MLNSVAMYLWGSSSETDQGAATKGEEGDQGSGATLQLSTQQTEDDDWILVGLDGQGDSVEGADSKMLDATVTTTAAWCAALSSSTTNVSTANSVTQDLSRVTPSRPPCSRVSTRAGGVVHSESASEQQLVRIERAAQQLQRCKAQKVITGQRCERQNKLRDFQSHPKVKTNNRRNKHMHASGAKCSRFSQRM